MPRKRFCGFVFSQGVAYRWQKEDPFSSNFTRLIHTWLSTGFSCRTVQSQRQTSRFWDKKTQAEHNVPDKSEKTTFFYMILRGRILGREARWAQPLHCFFLVFSPLRLRRVNFRMTFTCKRTTPVTSRHFMRCVVLRPRIDELTQTHTSPCTSR